MRFSFVWLLALLLAGCADGSASEVESLAFSDGSFAIEIEDSQITRPDGAEDGALRFFVVSQQYEDGSELSFEIAVPQSWEYVAEEHKFSDGVSSLAVLPGCDGRCGTREWLDHFGVDDFFDPAELNDGLWLTAPAHEDEPQFSSFSSGTDRVSLGLGWRFPDERVIHRVVHFHHRADRFVGCEVLLGGSAALDAGVAADLCRHLVVDFRPFVEEPVESPVQTVLTDAMEVAVVEGLVSKPMNRVPLEDGREVLMALPPGSVFEQQHGARLHFGAETEITLSETGFFSRIELAAPCVNLCQPQEWETVLNEPTGLLAQTRSVMSTIDNDAPIESGWLLSGPVAIGLHAYVIHVVKFDDSSGRVLSCVQNVEHEDLGIIHELAEVCISALPTWMSRE